MAKELAKQYDPSEVEDRTYKFWCDKKYFHAKREKNKKKSRLRQTEPASYSKIKGELLLGLLGLFPDILADESGQVAAVSRHALERITNPASLTKSNALGDVGTDLGLGLHVVKLMLHELFSFLIDGFRCH